MSSDIHLKWTYEELIHFFTTSEAILFDLDGTLFDLNVNWGQIKEHFKVYTKQKFNACLPSNRFYANFKFIERNYGLDELIYYMEYLKAQEIDTAKKLIPTPRWLANTGIHQIKNLIPKNTIFGIISSNFHDTVKIIIRNHKMENLFSIILGRDDVENAKPSPEGISKVVNRFKLHPNQVLYIGDVMSDKTAALEAGVHFIYEQDLKLLLKSSE